MPCPAHKLRSMLLTKARIKRFRERMGWSLEELGTKIGVTGQAVWTWESGSRTPSGPARKLLEQLMNGEKAEPKE